MLKKKKNLQTTPWGATFIASVSSTVTWIFAEGIFAKGIFAEDFFAEENFRLTELSPLEILPNGIFTEK